MITTLDLRNQIIPFGLLKASNAFKVIDIGEILEFLCSDPDSCADLLKILPSDSYELVTVHGLKGKQSGLRIKVRKINP
jgi:TusA-related sulfurtransferase